MPSDIDQLQGSWNIQSLEVEGHQMGSEMLSQARLEINGSQFTTTGMGAEYSGTLKLDNSVSPARLDMKFSSGPEKGNTNLGIYEMNGDSWRLCLATRGNVRPTTFSSANGEGFALEVLTRGVPAASAPQSETAASSSAPPSIFEGEWKLVSAVMDGKPMEESMVQWVKRVSIGDETTVYAGPQVMLKVKFTIDPSQSPKAVDYLGLAGNVKGKTQLGIYEFEGDMLKFNVAAPGDPRPNKFDLPKGAKGTLTIWKRA